MSDTPREKMYLPVNTAGLLRRHANILRSIKLMASQQPLTKDERRMMDDAIAFLDSLAERIGDAEDLMFREQR